MIYVNITAIYDLLCRSEQLRFQYPKLLGFHTNRCRTSNRLTLFCKHRCDIHVPGPNALCNSERPLILGVFQRKLQLEICKRSLDSPLSKQTRTPGLLKLRDFEILHHPMKLFCKLGKLFRITCNAA